MAHPRFGDIAVCVFDAYGTLFDYNTAAGRHVAALGDKAAPLAELWRHKQLQYTWLRSLMGRYTGFWQVTGEALDFSMGELGVEDDALRARLMEAYRTLDAYPEVTETLATLRAHGLRTAILSNGEPGMLESAVEAAGIGDHPRCRALGRGGRHLQASSFRVPTGGGPARRAAGKGELPVVQRLGCQRRCRLRFPRRLVQPLRPGARAYPGDA